MSRVSCVLTAILAALASGCAVRTPQTYRLVPQDRARVLVPPGVAGVETGSVALTATGTAWRPACDPPGDAVTVRARGKTLRVTVSRDALLRQPPGWLSQWAAVTEMQGCMPPGRSWELVGRIVESLPLDPSAAHRLLHSGTIQKGYIDLTPGYRLQVVTPVMKAGAAEDAPIVATTSVAGTDRQIDVTIRASENLTGVETAWYAVEPRRPGPGATIVPVAVERVVAGRSEKADSPLANYLQFAPGAAYYRLFYKTDPADNGVTHVVLAAPTMAELDARTGALAADGSMCRTSDPSVCAVFPRRVGVNPLIAVSVNGSEVRLPVGSTVRGAIQAARGRAPDDAVPAMKVFKPFGGKLAPVEFDAATRQILDLVLLGGESLSWE